MKQVVKVVKKGQGISSKRPEIDDIKNSLGLSRKSKDDLSKSCADKEISFIPMGEAFQEALNLPGIPEGYATIVTGWSNTGKSTLKNTLIANCQRMGILPVIFETEQNFDFKYATDCGMEATPVYEDVEVEYEYEVTDEKTGEVKIKTEKKKEKQIVDWEGNFIYFDSSILAQRYGNFDYSQGKEVKACRKVAVIEDIARAIGDILDAQDDGKIQQPICFIWDSVGSIPSFKSYTSKVGNHMFDAAALSEAFNISLNNRIPASKRIDAPYTNTFFCVNKIWNDSMNSVGGAASIELKGGKSFYYAARLILHVGGIAKAGTKKLQATAGGQTYQYGTETKIRVTKNQLPTPYNISYEGVMCCVHNGLISPNALESYKKTYAKDLLKKLEENNQCVLGDATLTFNEIDDVEVEANPKQKGLL